MPRIITLLFIGSTVALAQTTVYLPAVGAKACTITAASSATPSQITCANHGFSTGNVIAVINTVSTQTAGFIVNGLRKVTVVDSNSFTITDINGTNIPGPASWVCPSTGPGTNPMIYVRPVGCRAINSPPIRRRVIRALSGWMEQLAHFQNRFKIRVRRARPMPIIIRSKSSRTSSRGGALRHLIQWETTENKKVRRRYDIGP